MSRWLKGEKGGQGARLSIQLVRRCTKLTMTCVLGVIINSHQENLDIPSIHAEGFALAPCGQSAWTASIFIKIRSVQVADVQFVRASMSYSETLIELNGGV